MGVQVVPELQSKSPADSTLWGFCMYQGRASEKRSGLTRLTVRPLSVCTTGGDRTRDLQLSQRVALSAELQRYTSGKLHSGAGRFRENRIHCG